MTEKTPRNAEQETAPVLLPLPAALEVLDGDAVGFCSNGVCHLPAPSTR
ncbi:hypothetical protein [Microbacterium sp. NPDC055599]